MVIKAVPLCGDEPCAAKKVYLDKATGLPNKNK